MGSETDAVVSNPRTEKNAIVVTVHVAGRAYRVWGRAHKDTWSPGAVNWNCQEGGGPGNIAAEGAARDAAHKWAREHPEEMARLFATALAQGPKD
jgi:hypothetical protein